MRVFTNHICKMLSRCPILLKIANIYGNVLDSKCPHSSCPTWNHSATMEREAASARFRATLTLPSEHLGSWEYQSLGSWEERRWVKSPVSSHQHIVLESEACFCKAVCWLITKTLPRYPQLRPLVIFTWASRGDLTWLKSNRVKAQKCLERTF